MTRQSSTGAVGEDGPGRVRFDAEGSGSQVMARKGLDRHGPDERGTDWQSWGGGAGRDKA
jgi:hypothetical protein